VGWLDAVKPGGPLLCEAQAVTARASAVGFDWPDASGVWDKVAEELAELRLAVDSGEGSERVEAELGDLLMALANLSRFLDVDPQRGLAGALRRFRTRFAGMEAELARDDRRMRDLDLDTLEALWQRQKQSQARA